MQLLSEFATRGALREVDRKSIRSFVACNKHLLTGKVLDFGAGLQPYKDLVTGCYVPYTPGLACTPPSSPETGKWGDIQGNYDAVLCTQVVQYLDSPHEIFMLFSNMLWRNEGHLILTYPTNWPEEETADRHRFTKFGMEEQLRAAHFDIITHKCRGSIAFEDFSISFGYGVVARIGSK